MADQDKHSKTEQPTAKRVQEAKDKGNIPRSREMTSVITLIAAMTALYTTGGFMASVMKKTSRDVFVGISHAELTQAGAYALMLKMMGTVAMVLFPFLLIVIVAGVLVEVSQGGVVFTTEKLKLDLEKLSPLKGIARMFNKDALVEVIKSLLKIVIVGYMSYRILRNEIDNIVYLVELDLPGIAEFITHISFKIVLHTCGVLLILAVLDLAFVKWRFIENLMMTKQEIKEEHKEQEGDPQIKGKIKQRQYQMARRRMKQIIPTADVVVTNPTHFAVALKYDRMKMAAPVVIAKGADYMAQQIKAIAKESNVTLVENRFLARELFAQVEEGQEIPEALYAAVAEILAYVFSLKGKV